jgi:hypothetical protein
VSVPTALRKDRSRGASSYVGFRSRSTVVAAWHSYRATTRARRSPRAFRWQWQPDTGESRAALRRTRTSPSLDRPSRARPTTPRPWRCRQSSWRSVARVRDAVARVRRRVVRRGCAGGQARLSLGPVVQGASLSAFVRLPPSGSAKVLAFALELASGEVFGFAPYFASLCSRGCAVAAQCVAFRQHVRPLLQLRLSGLRG